MNASLYNGFDEDGLKKLIAELSKLAGRAERYSVLACTPEGKLMIADMWKRVDFIQKQYKFIDPSNPQAANLLAMLQSSERETKEWLDKLTNIKEYPKEINLKIDALKKVISARKSRPRRSNQIAPTESLGKKQ